MSRGRGQHDTLQPWQARLIPEHVCLTGHQMEDTTEYPSPPPGMARVLCPRRGCRRPLFIKELAKWVEVTRMSITDHPMINQVQKGTTNANKIWWFLQRCENCGRWGHIGSMCDQVQVQMHCTFCGNYLHDVYDCPLLYAAQIRNKAQVLQIREGNHYVLDAPDVPAFPIAIRTNAPNTAETAMIQETMDETENAVMLHDSQKSQASSTVSLNETIFDYTFGNAGQPKQSQRKLIERPALKQAVEEASHENPSTSKVTQIPNTPRIIDGSSPERRAQLRRIFEQCDGEIQDSITKSMKQFFKDAYGEDWDDKPKTKPVKKQKSDNAAEKAKQAEIKALQESVQAILKRLDDIVETVPKSNDEDSE